MRTMPFQKGLDTNTYKINEIYLSNRRVDQLLSILFSKKLFAYFLTR